MPKTVFDAELNNVKTAIFLNPNEEAPWTYYSWLLKQLIPAFVVRRSANQLILNMKVGDFSQLLVPSDGATLTAKDNTISSAYWTILSQEQHVKVVSSYSLRTGHIGMEYTGHRFLGEERSKENVAFVKELLKKEETFLLEVIES